MKRRLICGMVCCLLLCAAGCGRDRDAVRIADQFGLAYAPLAVVRERGLLEQRGIEVEWVRLGNASAIREAMSAGRVDVGFMGIPPYLIGRDRGVAWEVFTGLTRAGLGLVSNDARIDSLEAIGRKDRIALPQPGSIQHILLSMASERRLAQADRFDGQLVSMKHPDGLQALKAKADITLLFTAPPYLQMANEMGFATILTGEEAFGGPFTFIVGVASLTFATEQKETLEEIRECLEEAMRWMEAEPKQARALLAKAYGLSEEEIGEYLDAGGLTYELDILGIDRFEAFMRRAGYLEGGNP